jgi:non-homologous end joining protein Ku
MLELIQQKVEGKEITVASAEEPKTQIIDLMAALKASLSGEERKPASRAEKKGGEAKAPAKKAADKAGTRKKKVAGE